MVNGEWCAHIIFTGDILCEYANIRTQTHGLYSESVLFAKFSLDERTLNGMFIQITRLHSSLHQPFSFYTSHIEILCSRIRQDSLVWKMVPEIRRH